MQLMQEWRTTGEKYELSLSLRKAGKTSVYGTLVEQMHLPVQLLYAALQGCNAKLAACLRINTSIPD